jgi:hypothetical protein
MKKKIYSLLILAMFTFVYFVYQSIGNEKYPKILYIKSFVPNDFNSKLKKLKQFLTKTEHHGNKIKKVSYEDKYDFILKKGNITFEKLSVDDFSYKNNNFKLTKYKSEDLGFSKHPEYKAIGTSYIDFYQDNIILVTGHGLVYYAKKNHEPKKIELINIPTNIKEIVKYKEFYSSSLYGIKDILIVEDFIYASFVNEKEKSCWNTSILRSKMNLNKIEFKPFFIPKACVKEKNEYGKIIDSEVGSFWEGQSGGRLETFKDGKIIFSTGEFRYQTHAQDSENFLGKVLSIDPISGKKDLISLGHRNPQGLMFDKERNIIISTEHGPSGGDEINMNDLRDKKVKNFGWPISSYGKHYYPSDKLYKVSPLYKSHSKYGFEEPIKQYTPALGISEVEKFKINNDTVYLVGALGKKIEEGDMSIHFFSLDQEFKMNNNKIWPINDRVRDMVFDTKTETVYLYLETTGSIGTIRKN